MFQPKGFRKRRTLMSISPHGSESRSTPFFFAVALLTMLTAFGFPLVHVCFAGESAPDTVVFVNGDRLSGTFVEASHDILTFAGTVTGTLSIRWNLVKKVELANEALALTNSADRFTIPASSLEVLGETVMLTSRTCE